MTVAWSQIFETVSRISTPLSYSAFCAAAVLFVLSKVMGRRSKVDTHAGKLIRRGCYGLLALALISLVGHFALQFESLRNSIYRVRVTVTDGHLPVENASIWSSVGGETKTIRGGSEIDIPKDNRPADGKITLYATRPNTSHSGNVAMTLDQDHNPSIEIVLKADDSAMIRGSVEDEAGHTLGGVDVSVLGYGDEHIVTPATGTFVLPAHTADGETVRLHAQAAHYQPLDQDQPAGDLAALLVLHKTNGKP